MHSEKVNDNLKAYLICGSPNADGSTMAILHMLASELGSVGFTTATELLDQCKIGYCKGCKTCKEQLRCVQRDDMDQIIEKMTEADVLVLASPSYWGDVTGQMKVFIDRCTPLCENINNKSMPEGKLGISISLRAGTNESENTHLLECFEHFFNHLRIKPIKRFSLTQVNKKVDLRNKTEELLVLKDIAIVAAAEIQNRK